MKSILRQIAALTALNLRSATRRVEMSIAAIVGVALAVGVLIFFLALVSGLDAAMKGSGDADHAIVLRGGSESELNSVVTRGQVEILEGAPGIRRVDGRPAVSGELLVIVDGIRRSNGLRANLALRGVSAEAQAVRRGFHITQGRMFAPGSNEIIVGAGLLREFSGFELGRSVALRGALWRVVGVFEVPGTAFESEMWADLATTQSMFARLNAYQSVRIALTDENAIDELRAFVSHDPRLHLEALSERDFYTRLSARSGQIIRFIAWPLAITMAIGALAGALNTMYSSVAARRVEIATLRLIGFSGYAAFFATMAEAVSLALLGGLLAVLICMATFGGMTTSTLGGGFTQLVFQFQISSWVAAQALMMAAVIGVVGGVAPGIRAARERPALAL